MPTELENIVQRMIDAGEDEENIASVIKEYKPSGPAKPEPYKPVSNIGNNPTTFAEGVINSFKNDDVKNAARSSLGGYAKGALLDLPGSIGSGIKTIGGLLTDPVNTATDIYSGLKNAPASFADTVMKAGSEPENFGRMMGNMTGQPLVTAGLAKGAPYAPKMAVGAMNRIGGPVETIGRVTGKEGFVSGILPPITTPRYLKFGERMIGRGIEHLGQKMQSATLPESLNPASITDSLTRARNVFKSKPESKIETPKIELNKANYDKAVEIIRAKEGGLDPVKFSEMDKQQIIDYAASLDPRLAEVAKTKLEGPITKSTKPKFKFQNGVYVNTETGEVITPNKDFSPEPSIRPQFKNKNWYVGT